MSMVSHWTHSRLVTLNQCPKRFFYGYVLKLKPEKTDGPQFGTMGSCAHAVIEDFYHNITIPCAPEEDFDDLIGRLYIHHFSDVDDYQERMLGGLKNFLTMEIDRYHSLDDKDLFLPKHNEIYIKSDIEGIPFSGRVDAVYQEEGLLSAVDYKFTGKRSIGAEQRQQAGIYAILLEKELGIEFTEFTFWFLLHGTDKKRVIRSVKIDEKIIYDVHQNINKGVEQSENLQFDRKPSYLCRWCDYQDLCLTEMSGV